MRCCGPGGVGGAVHRGVSPVGRLHGSCRPQGRRARRRPRCGRRIGETGDVTEHAPAVRHFASDNYAGVHPEVLAAVAEANVGHVPAYGDDPWTARLQEVVREQLGEHAVAYPVLNGTGANVVALQAMLPRWGAVVCSEAAHVHTDENGAPERVGGLKLLTVPAPDGRLTPELVARQAWGFGDVHRAQPGVVSLTQATELGTVYTPQAVRELCDQAHALGMRVHMDGARLANAAAHLGLPLRALTTDCGVDVLSLGGTKNGLLLGEAVVVLDPEAVAGVEYLRKSDMQLTSKMRFVSAQLVALYEGDLWLRSAQHANAMAARLRAGIDALGALQVAQPTEANAVFVRLPAPVAEALRRRWRFYDWDVTDGTVRLMCAFDTTPQDVDELLDALRHALADGDGAGATRA
ncbi:low specificity L-threonine aldolase [Cellulomonas dongxiuzhuiae]|uniref:Low specificity L-threonine aldolase n=1 Tax=Cellulomonas dongxiuzhuiae TaxID=2819979 RepID=A0ABX8GEP5_9CELL|nr:low specificity L-threonine aldolase [Cellulomonas dongxiuzhuiae]QWC14604.1 low specificity L-threonine aldolase [Cellulomonas dongxiuzhuiae]